jgi:PAS domain S-box-containing protein
LFEGVTLFAAAAGATAILAAPFLGRRWHALLRSAKLSEQRKADLESANRALQHETGERQRVEGELSKLNAELERRVQDRTSELEWANQDLASIAAMVEYSNDAIVGLNLNQRIVSWNRAAERMYGYRAGEVMGQPITLLAPVDLSNETPDLIERLRKGENAGSVETIRIRKDGERINVYLTVSLIRNAAGEIQRISHVARDITERKRAEEMFRLAVDAAPNAMVMVDDRGRIVLVNSQTERLFGYHRDELVGQEVGTLAPRKDRAGNPEYWPDLLFEPGSRAPIASRELYGRRKDGSEFPVEVGVAPIETERGTWALSAIVDITGRKRAEEEIRRLTCDLERRVAERTSELTAVNAELESFSYSVSHDLRAPLRQIAGFSRILLEECAELSPDCQRYLQRVQSGAQQMGNLIDNLLNLARVGRQVVLRQPTPLNALVGAVLEEFAADCAGREIEWQIGELWSVECDPGLVKQIFVNLLANALKYTRLRSRAEIQVGQRILDGERVIFVRDNGAGFDLEYAGKLFGVFQRFHSSEIFEGTGIGLAIVQRIVHKHGGRIWAESAPDQGATFSFTLPDPPEQALTRDEVSNYTGGER